MRTRYLYSRERHKRELNPCPGRTSGERKYITRRLIEVRHLWAHALAQHLTDGIMPEWLPINNVTPTLEEMSADNRQSYIDADTDEYGCFIDGSTYRIRAANTITVAACFNTPGADYPQQALLQKIIVSPFLHPVWGALPLTRSQWNIIAPISIQVHMHWSWIHSARLWSERDDLMPDGCQGWHMNLCKPLPQSNYEGEPEWSLGRDIYKQVSSRLSTRLSYPEQATRCP